MKRSVRTVNQTGAPAGTVLRGCAPHNNKLRLRTLQQQENKDGPASGYLLILDVGDNVHSDSLRELVNKPTDATEVVSLIRRGHSACLSVVNRNALVLESPQRRDGVVSDPDFIFDRE